MNICHLTSVHQSMDTRILIKECQSLAKAGHSVTYIVPNAETRMEHGVQIVGVEAKEEKPLNRMRKTTAAVFQKAIEVDADVYHFHDPELMPIGLKLKKRGKAVIYDVHEDLPQQIMSKQWIPGKLRKGISFGSEKVERFASKRFDAIVTATPHINERFKKYNENSITIHNYPLLNELMKDVVVDKPAKDAFSVVYLGGIYLLRGIKEMIRSVEKVNETTPAEFILGGSFAPPSLHDDVKTMSGWKHVDFRGYLDRAAVKNTLAEADAGLVLLHPEPRFIVSLPIKMFEYMSAGIPVIASNFPLWKEIVETNNCGICVDPLNIDDVSNAMIWLKENPEKAKEMGENGRRAVEQYYNWDKESERLVALYEKIVK
ncbi:glycosyltransferase family 4 protein [Alkalihalobacillus sp. CinArs1]|uniref:glycosyltransferase family 4 protein n=1 Tax=Alkalihalobacillus sp. CinArs1 TaxID=2995314 RepID=UPI0022DDC3A5|nr:glycosyltransferase family 4 protein [Alkalihalobacillus sp. CinArs1]